MVISWMLNELHQGCLLDSHLPGNICNESIPGAVYLLQEIDYSADFTDFHIIHTVY